MHGVFKKGLLDKVVADLETVGEVSFKRDMAILSLVGKQMKNMVGIAGRMFR
jgi:aspartate kinase